jgi:hypothetical protein
MSEIINVPTRAEPATAPLLAHGFHRGIPDDIYHASDYVSPSRAKHALVSALDYKWHCEHPSEQTDEMSFGTLAHSMFLEPDSLPLKYAVWRGGVRRGNKYDEFCYANEHSRILTEDEYRAAVAVRDSLNSHPAVRQIIRGDADKEISLRWQDKATGLECRGRMDYLRPLVLADLKTIKAVTDKAIVQNCYQYHYALSMAAYGEGLKAIGYEPPPAYLIFVESKPPYDVSVKLIESDELMYGQKQWREALKVIAKARDTGKYPGISSEILPLVLPDWAMDRNEGKPLSLTIGGESVEM